MKIYPPIRQGYTQTGLRTLQNLDDLKQVIGQTFNQNFNIPACVYYPQAPCNITVYEYNGKKGHGALDFKVPTGTVIYAATDGRVIEVSEDLGAGLGVVLFDPIQKIKTYYWHNKSHMVATGSQVKAGQPIAISDNTGISTGSHLHFALKETDNNGNTINKNNGYQGAVDPWPHFVWYNYSMENALKRANKDVYLIKEGKKHLFINGFSFQVIDGRWSMIETVPQSELDAIPDGSVLIAVANE